MTFRIRSTFADVPDTRRRNMAAIRGKDTKPELVVRRLLHSLGYRYRLHGRDLPGKPDIVLAARRKIVEIRGCFWHRHPGCPLAAVPVTRADFWQKKFSRNVARDAENLAALERLGWDVLVVWECEAGAPELRVRLENFLGPARHGAYPKTGLSKTRSSRSRMTG